MMAGQALLTAFFAEDLQGRVDWARQDLIGASTTIDVGAARAVILVLWVLCVAQVVFAVLLAVRVWWARPVTIVVELTSIAIGLGSLALGVPVLLVPVVAVLPAG